MSKIPLLLSLLFITFNSIAQSSTHELCNNGIDDDGDGLIDCCDQECIGVLYCQLPSAQAKYDCRETGILCNNGIDDDNDGYIDNEDADCLEDPENPNEYIVDNYDCEAAPMGSGIGNMEVTWQSANQTSAVYGMPVVADIDNDGTPEVISSNNQSSYIYIISGKDGTTELSKNSGLGTLFGNPSVADVDSDGTGEIFVIDNNGKLKAYHHDLSDFWTSNQTSCYTTFGRQLGLADFNGDGIVELYQVNEIRNAETGNVIIAGSHGTAKYPSANNWETELNATPVAVDILPDNYPGCTDCQGLELIVGHIIYSVSIESGKLTERLNMNNAATKPADYLTTGYFPKHAGFAGQSYSTTSTVDINNDGYLDVLLSGTTGNAHGPTTLFLWDIHHDAVKSFVVTRAANSIPNSAPSNIRTNFRDLNGNSCDNGETCTSYRGMGVPAIANIDTDPALEITFASGSSLYALDNNLTVKWQNNDDFWDSGSGHTGVSVFDFDGDGAAEILYRDEIDLYIVNGTDGTIANSDYDISTFCSSQTQAEYPIVADVDGDGKTEIIVSCGQLPNTFGDTNTATGTNRQNGHIKAYKAADNNYWTPARKIWNQFMYFNVNVNDDMSIPRFQKAHHLSFAQTCHDPNAPARFPLNTSISQSPRLNSCGQVVFSAAKLDFRSDSVSVVPPVCPENTFQVRLFFENNGDAAVNQPIPVSFYSANPLVGHNPSEEPYLYTQEFSVAGGLQPGAHLDTTITVVGQRGDFRLYVSLNDRGQYDENGSLMPSSSFYPLTELNGPVRECDSSPTVMSKAIVARPFRIIASTVSDNLNCKGVSNNNGEVEVTKEDGSAFSAADYTFTWTNISNGKTVGTTAYVGSLPAGSYVVKVTGTKFTCSSIPDTAVVDLKNSWSEFDVVTTESLKEVSNCKDKTADGEARVLINGVEPNLNDYDIAWTNQESGATVSLQPHAKALEAYVHYVRIVNKLSGCAETGIIDMTLKRPKFSVIAKDNPSNCVNPNGTIQLAPEQGDVADYRYFLLTSAHDTITANTNGTFENLAEGTYQAYMYNPANKCGKFSNSSQVKLIAEKKVLNVSASIIKNQTACVVPYTGQLTVNTPSPENYEYHWYRLEANGNQVTVSNAPTTPDTLSSRQYFVTMLNKTSLCDTTIAITLTDQITLPIASVTTVDNTSCSLPNGSITATASGGQPENYTFKLIQGTSEQVVANNATGEFTHLTAGRYTLIVTDESRACKPESDPVVVVIRDQRQLLLLDIKLIAPQTLCSDSMGNGHLQAVVEGDINNYDFTWYKGDELSGEVVSNAAEAIKLSTDGKNVQTYVLKVIHKITLCESLKAYELQQEISYPIIREPNYAVTAQTLCAIPNGNIQLSVNGNTDKYSFRLFQKGTSSASYSENNSDGRFEYLAAGTYLALAYDNTTVCLTPDSLATIIVIPESLSTPKIDSLVHSPQTSLEKPDGAILVYLSKSENITDYTFQWLLNGQVVAGQTNSLSNLQSGTYALSITNKHSGCVTDTSIVVESKVKLQQAITFEQIEDKVYDDNIFTLNAVSNSGLPISFLKVQGPVTIENGQIHIAGVGAVTIEATQAGSEQYEAAEPVSVSFAIVEANQIITFDPIDDQSLDAKSLILQATASSGLPATYQATGPVMLEGNTLTFLDAGLVTITAGQQGDENYLSAAEVSQSFFIQLAETPEEPTDSVQKHVLSVKISTFNKQPLPSFSATLYLKSQGKYGVVETKEGGNATFSFENLQEGEAYAVGIRPVGMDFLPSYSGNKIMLQDAKAIVLRQDTLQHITLFSKPTGNANGSSIIKGILLRDTDSNNGRILAGKNTQSSEVLADIPVYLLHPDTQEVLAYAVTDAQGNFSFPGLEAGQYLLVADYQGLPNDNQQNLLHITSGFETLTVTAVAGSHVRVTEVQRVKQVTAIPEDDLLPDAVRYYPNPVHDQLLLQLTSDWLGGELRLSDTSGKLLNKWTATALEMKLLLKHLSAGVYTVTLSKDKRRQTFKIYKQ